MIETKRLKIFPLNYEQVVKYIENKSELEKKFGLNQSNWLLPEHLIKMLKIKMLPVLKEKCKDNSETEKFMFNTIWLAVDKIINAIVGDFGVKGDPNEEGEIEIGYGTQSGFQNKGYMTEMIGGFVSFAEKRKEVKYIIAETNKDNHPSIRVLEKNNFEVFLRGETSRWWKKCVNNQSC